METVGELIKKAENNDVNGTTTISEFVIRNQRSDINKTEAYYNSQFLSGNTDADGRPKPFKNVCKPAVNIWYRAISRKLTSLYFLAGNNDQKISALLASIKLHEWIKRENISLWNSEWEFQLAKHGAVVVEIVEKEKKLYLKNLSWNEIIVDPINFEQNIKIKVLYLTPSELKQNKSYNKELVKSLLESKEVRKTSQGKQVDNRADYIKIYEVHGELPVALLKLAKGEEPTEEDEDNYSLQMHVVAFNGKKDGNTKEEEVTLFAGPKQRETLFLTKLFEDDLTYPGGAVYNLFETQWMINDTEKMIRDHLLITSKAIFQGSDDSMSGANVFTEVDNGEYLVHKPNEPMTRVQTSPDISALQSQQSIWEQFGNKINGIADAMIQQPNAGAAWRQVQAQLQEAHSLFEKMGDVKDYYLKKLFKDGGIIEFFKKQLKGDSKEISKILEAHEIKMIDSKYLSNEVNQRMNQKIKDVILSGETYNTAQLPADQAQITQQIQSELAGMGNQRFVKPAEVDWSTELEDLDWDFDLTTQSDSVDIQNQMATYQTALQFLTSLQGRPMTDEEQMIFNNLVSLTGTISPLQLNQSPKPQLNQPQPAQMSVAGK